MASKESTTPSKTSTSVYSNNKKEIVCFFALFIYKGQSSRSPIIGPENKSFETPAVNQYFFFFFFFLNAVGVFCQN